MDLDTSQKFFFVGVAGAGMSAIAQYLAGKGFEVGGSDRTFTQNPDAKVRAQLEAAGIRCFENDGSGVRAGLDALVVSTAIEASNPDLQKAHELGIKTLHRSEMLSQIVAQARTIAVSGTSGKSTVTGMIYHILAYAGLSPSLITGAGLVSLEKQGKIGNGVAGKGEWLVIEADESDGSLVRYSPEIGLILNIDKDHKEISELEEIFGTFTQNVLAKGGILIANGDREAARKYASDRKFLFGSEQAYGTQGVDFKAIGTAIEFRVRHAGELVKFTLPLPGKHNMENALAATAAASAAGVPLRKIAEALETFEGIHRRHQILGTFGGVTLVDDFAHNPAKMAASIRSVFAFTKGRVLAWFQPHGFGPTRFLRYDIVTSLREALRPGDLMYFSQIYYAGGTVTRDISAGDLASDLNSLGAKCVYEADRNACARLMVDEAKPGDTILLMGARDPKLSDFAESVAALLRAKGR